MYVASCPPIVVWTGLVAVVFGTSPSAVARAATVDPIFGLRWTCAQGSLNVLSTRLTMKAMPDGGLDVPRSAPKPNWIDSQPEGRVTVSRSGGPITSVPATVRVAACWLELGSREGVPADDEATAVGETTVEGATAVGETTGDGVTATGPQAMQDTTTAAAAKIILSVLVTD